MEAAKDNCTRGQFPEGKLYEDRRMVGRKVHVLVNPKADHSFYNAGRYIAMVQFRYPALLLSESEFVRGFRTPIRSFACSFGEVRGSGDGE